MMDGIALTNLKQAPSIPDGSVRFHRHQPMPSGVYEAGSADSRGRVEGVSRACYVLPGNGKHRTIAPPPANSVETISVTATLSVRTREVKASMVSRLLLWVAVYGKNPMQSRCSKDALRQYHHKWSIVQQCVYHKIQRQIEFPQRSRPSVLNCTSCIGSSIVPTIHESARTTLWVR